MQLYGFEEQLGHIFFCVCSFLVKKSYFNVPRVYLGLTKEAREGEIGGRGFTL